MRKIDGNIELESKFETALSQAKHLIERELKTKNKLYSLHAPEVECIAKGKAHKPYEFGCKVSLVTTHKKGRGLIIGCQAKHGNPFDGHTLKDALTQTKELTTVAIKEAFCDRGYKGNGVESCAVYISGQRRGISKAAKKRLKRRQAIEPYIGHMKKIGRLGLCRLKGKAGDEINALLAAAGYNIKLILNHLRKLFTQILELIFSQLLGKLLTI